MKSLCDKARELLSEWKSEAYVFGVDDSVYDHIGFSARKVGEKALVVVADLGQDWIKATQKKVEASLAKAGVGCDLVLGAAPNAPREDVYRLALAISMLQPACVVAVGGGSTIDAAKAAASLAAFTPGQKMEILGSSLADASSIEPFFGVDRISEIVEKSGRAIAPVIAVQTAASSGAHLTKYANVTDPTIGTKRLEVDYANVPAAAVFDFRTTMSSPAALKVDGGLDGIAHCWEVFMGSTGKAFQDEMHRIAITAIDLIVQALPRAHADPDDLEAHVALGLGTDLGGYAIMIEKRDPETGKVERGGTNGGHLGSFQLTDYLSHGRACAVLNPYYTVLFAGAIELQCRAIGAIYRKHGFINTGTDLNKLSARQLAIVVARGMIALSERVNFPTSLREADVPEDRTEVMVAQSENPQLASKLQNMPVRMSVTDGDVRKYILPTLQAAYSGQLERVPEIA